MSRIKTPPAPCDTFLTFPLCDILYVPAVEVTSRRSCTMSGILKRKLDEGPSPYLSSLQGSDDDEVSCSDSGNSSDSLNHPVPSGLLDCKATPPHRVCTCRYVTDMTDWQKKQPLCYIIKISKPTPGRSLKNLNRFYVVVAVRQ